MDGSAAAAKISNLEQELKQAKSRKEHLELEDSKHARAMAKVNTQFTEKCKASVDTVSLYRSIRCQSATLDAQS